MPQLVVKLKDREIQRVSINSPRTRIGRDPTNDVVIDNMGISRYHAIVEFDGENFFVRDEGSANGIYVNGENKPDAVLKNGDAIQLGKFSVIFSRGGGTTLEKLARHAQLPGLEAPAMLGDPHMTTALAPADIERLINAQLAAPAETTAPAAAIDSPVPQRLAAPHDGTVFSRRTRRLREQADALKSLTIVLTVAVVGIVGLTVALLTLG